MDERGAFIHVSREEFEAVAEFIKTRGRVSISALAAESGKLIDLEPKREKEAGGEEGLLWTRSLGTTNEKKH